MSGLEHNADAVALRLARAGDGIRAALQRELAGLAHRVAADLRRAAPKFRSTLANSVGVVQEDASGLSWQIYPTMDYAASVEHGRKPGKGLPRFFDPASASIVAWLDANRGGTSNAGPVRSAWRTARKGSARRTAAELDLRDRYMALSRHVKLRGIKPHPFVVPTAQAARQTTTLALVDAVRRGARAAGFGASP